MKNPILSGSGYKLYVLAWIIIALAHSAILYFYYHFDLSISLADSIIYNGSFAMIAPSFWYIANFGSKAKDTLSLIGMHAGAAALSIILWAGLSPYPLKLLFGEDIAYLAFNKSSYIWRIITGLLYYSIIILIFYLIKYYQDMRARTKRENELQHLLKDSELRMLKSQINPHFIFNSLNSISSLTISKPELAQEMVIKLSSFLRHSLGKQTNEMNTLKEEIENASLYLDIEKIRFGSRLQYQNEIEESLLSLKVPNLILQPLFENAIKHGLYESMEEVFIKLTSEKSSDLLKLVMTNNFDTEAISQKGTGIGLQNVSKRLQLIYGQANLLSTTKEQNTFTAEIKIPIR